ncbi:hypothetical protein RZE82_07020 [Mollicutes bacterium LVI A0039]|nr:hypothetical protein RZE82_07020 [Mollicutes bacterium LVI A0039]
MKRIKEKLKKLGFTKKSFLITCGVAVLVLTIATMLVTNYFITNSKEWEKYNGHIDNTFVTNQELEEHKTKLFEESMQVVTNVVSDELVISKIDYLSKQKLNEEQQQILSNILTVHTSFDETKDYTLDEIISLATDYSKLVTDIESLFTEVKATELTTSINDLEKKIQEHQKGISKLALTSGEQTELDKHVKSYKDVKFNKDTTYTIDELELIKTKFTDVNKQFDSLSKKVKDRIAKEQTEAEKQQAQATIYNQSGGYTEGNYNSSPNINTNTSSANTSNSGPNNASTISQRCEFSSNEELIAYGESTGRGYQGVPCGDGSYRINIFDGDNTGNNNGFYID